MKLWLRIFFLSLAVSGLAIGFTGYIALRSGYRSILETGNGTLRRETRLFITLLQNQYETWAANSAGKPGLASIEAFIKESAPGMIPSGIDVEVRSAGDQPILSLGAAFRTPGIESRPEVDLARRGKTAWILRRVDGHLMLVLSTPIVVSGWNLIGSLAMNMDGLDAYLNRQSMTLLLSGLPSLLFLALLSYTGGKAISRRLVTLTARAGAIASGEWTARVDIRGRDETAVLSKSFNTMAASIEATVERLRAEKEDRQTFIDGLTHELRTPITAIIGFAEHLRLRAYNEKVFSRGLDRIRAEGYRILKLSEDLKRLLISGAEKPGRAMAAAGEVLRAVALEAGERWTDRRIIVLEPEGSAGFTVDAGLVETALRNLVNNAAAASPPGSQIEIGCEISGAEGIIFIRDNGPGIGKEPPEGMARSTTGGLGIGLSLCAKIAEHCGARLELARRPGSGTIARLIFPNLQGIYTPDTGS